METNEQTVNLVEDLTWLLEWALAPDKRDLPIEECRLKIEEAKNFLRKNRVTTTFMVTETEDAV